MGQKCTFGGLEFGCSWCFFQFFTISACHQFVLSILHDKMGQNFSLGNHILSSVICFIIKGEWKLLQPLALLYDSVKTVFGESIIMELLDQTDKRHLKKRTEIRARIHMVIYTASEVQREKLFFLFILVHLSCHFSVVSRCHRLWKLLCCCLCFV